MLISDWSSDVCSSDLHQTATHSYLLELLQQKWQWLDKQLPPPHRRARQIPRHPLQLQLMPIGSAILRFQSISWRLEGEFRHGHVKSPVPKRSEEHTSELQSLMRISYAVFCLKKKKNNIKTLHQQNTTQ